MMAFKEVRSGNINIFRPWDSSSENKSVEGALSENSSSTSSLIANDPENIDSQFQESVRKRCTDFHPQDLPSVNTTPYCLNFQVGDISTNSTMQWSRPHPLQSNLRSSLPHHSHPDNQSVLSRPEILLQPHPSFPFADPMFYEQFQQQTILTNPVFHEQSLLEASSAITKQWKLQQQKKQRPKRFQCPHCRVSFSNNGQLKGHIRIHTGLFKLPLNKILLQVDVKKTSNLLTLYKNNLVEITSCFLISMSKMKVCFLTKYFICVNVSCFYKRTVLKLGPQSLARSTLTVRAHRA